MTSRTLVLPYFDTLELTGAAQPGFANYEKLSPVRAGTVVAGLRAAHHRGRWHRFFDEIIFSENTYSFSYTHKPLLLYFYEHDWGDASRAHLQQLNALRAELSLHQVNLLVVTAFSLPQFRELSRTAGLLLDVLEDRGNELASLLGLYADQSPSWGRYAGIERNVALPGLYLLDGLRQVALACANEAISDHLPLDAVLSTLQPTDHYQAERKSA